jgi:hypothetical protein
MTIKAWVLVVGTGLIMVALLVCYGLWGGELGW